LSVVSVWAKVGNYTDTKEKKDDVTVYIDVSDMKVLEQKPEQKEKSMNDIEDWNSVQNVSSNENADEGEMLRNYSGVDPELERMQKAAAKSLSDSKNAREKALREMEAELSSNTSTKRDNETPKNSVKVKGNVTVEYSFENPVRHGINIEIPAYLCENGGKVVVEAVLNQGGEVVFARAISGGDERMRQVAEEYARKSSFNIDNTAPKKQKGTITYIFIPQ
jgi:hypothetical protein